MGDDDGQDKRKRSIERQGAGSKHFVQFPVVLPCPQAFYGPGRLRDADVPGGHPEVGKQYKEKEKRSAKKNQVPIKQPLEEIEPITKVLEPPEVHKEIHENVREQARQSSQDEHAGNQEGNPPSPKHRFLLIYLYAALNIHSS
jgi:hypothetical protein